MTPGHIVLLLISLITCLLIFGITFGQDGVQHLVTDPSQEELQYEEECGRINSRFSNKTTEYTMVKLGGATQRLCGKILREHGIKVAQFLSVPFVNRPKRFRKPEQQTPVWSGVRDATVWPPLCMQNKLTQYDYLTRTLNSSIAEDCLFVNIWTPHDDLVRPADRTNRVHSANSLLPVVIFIPGGGFNYMGLSYQAHNGASVAAIGKIVFVSISYRLGIFGFFNGEQHYQSNSSPQHLQYSPNVGLYDQLAAIQYVSDSIHYFGGDPSSITLQGQSAGAISIGLLMLSPLSNHLFHRAILQSASPMMPKQMFTRKHYTRVVDLANCSVFEPDPLTGSSEEESGEWDGNFSFQRDQWLLEMQCLEKLSAYALNRIQETMIAEFAICFGPVIPSDILPDFPADLLRRRNFTRKDILLGANANEAALYLHHEFPEQLPLEPFLHLNRTQIEQIIKRLSGESSSSATRLLFDMFAQNNITTDKEIARHFVSFLSDFLFKGPVFKFATMWSEASPKSSVFLYMFNQSESQYPPWVGPAHWIEMDFVFGIPLQEPQRFSKEEQELSFRMIQSFTHFAKTGRMLPQAGLSWPPFSHHHGQHMVLQSSISSLGDNLAMHYYPYFELMYDAS